MSAEVAIELQQVNMGFGDKLIHRDISLCIPKGEIVTFLGPSGTGKTVLLKLMMGLLQPISGRIKVLGEEIQDLHEDALRIVRKKLGMLFQGAALFDSLSVGENVSHSLVECGDHEESEIEEIVEEKLSIVGLSGFQERYPSELSGGQRKRVGLARALASSPQVIFFDEPTTGLDPTAIRMIDELILHLKDEYGITSIVVTHDILSAERISDRWILLGGGRVIADGAVEEVAQQHESVIKFISGNWRDDYESAGQTAT